VAPPLWLRWAPVALISLAVVTVPVLWWLFGPPVPLLVVATLLLGAAVLALWNSVLAITEEDEPSLEDALSLGLLPTEDERKQSVLRALKDLAYEHAVGKLSDEDHARLTEHYRAEARALLREAGSQDPELEAAKKQVERHLADLEKRGALPAVSGPAPAPLQDPSPAAQSKPSREPTLTTKRECPQCGVSNDSDARFCKNCGAALGAEPAPNQTTEGASS
jgi:hypothetical protein